MPRQDNVFRFEIHAECVGQAIQNHIDYVGTDSLIEPTLDDLEEILARLGDYWTANMTPLLPVEYEVNAYYLKEITDAQITGGGTSPPYEYLYDHQFLYIPEDPVTGDLDEDFLPTYAAASVWKTTAVTSRNYRASLRFAPIVESQTLANQLDPDFKTDIQVAFQGIISIATVGGVEFNAVVLSGLKLAQDVAPTPVPRTYSRDIRYMIVRPFLGTQLSRKRRLG